MRLQKYEYTVLNFNVYYTTFLPHPSPLDPQHIHKIDHLSQWYLRTSPLLLQLDSLAFISMEVLWQHSLTPILFQLK